jgi:alpha-tubulin suppressor-like RCC1 family protein
VSYFSEIKSFQIGSRLIPVLLCTGICSGQVAVITPRQVICGIGSKRVKVIAVAKHHTIVATDGGEVFTWGSNRG